MGKQGLEGTKTLESELWAWEREKGRLVGRQPRWLVSRKKTIRVGGRRGMVEVEVEKGGKKDPQGDWASLGRPKPVRKKPSLPSPLLFQVLL